MARTRGPGHSATPQTRFREKPVEMEVISAESGFDSRWAARGTYGSFEEAKNEMKTIDFPGRITELEEQPFQSELTITTSLESLRNGSSTSGLASKRFWSEAKALANIALPCAMGNFLLFLPVTFQLIFVGHLSDGMGKKALDGVALGRAYFNATALSIGFGMISALRTLCPQAVGAGRPELCRLYAQRSAAIAFFALIPCVVLVLSASSILKALGQPPEISELAGDYCARCIPQLYGMISFTILQRVMQALDMNWTNLCICAIVCSLAPFVLYFYIFFLDLGLYGAGWAASTYTWFYVFLSVPALATQGHGDLFVFQGLEIFDIQGAKEYMALALPGTLQLCLEWWVLEVVSILAGLLPNPVVTIGASYIAYNLEGLMVMLWIGNLIGISIRVGEHIGARRVAQARTAASLGFAFAVFLGLLSGTTIFFTRREIVYLYTTDESIREVSATLMSVLAVLVFCDACNNAAGGIMNGLGLQRGAAMFQLVGYWGVGIPTAVISVFFFTQQYPILWLWGSVALAMASSCTLQVLHLARHDWTSSVEEAEKRLQKDVRTRLSTRQPSPNSDLDTKSVISSLGPNKYDEVITATGECLLSI
uniref:Multidrug and toxin extrusion protein n=1 Tax=Lotharella globosa TaxID=91324 RepID=A0A7S3ZER8_9EUKA